MLKPSALNTKKFLSSLCCLGITFVLLAGLWRGGFFSRADTALYDYFLRLKIQHSPKSLNPQIIPVDLNDRSEMVLGERLADRSAFGDLFAVLGHSGAQAALDFIYKGEREQDASMLEAAAALETLVVAVIPVPEGRENVSYRELLPDEESLLKEHIWKPAEYGQGTPPRAGTFVMPFLELGKSASQLAHLTINPDSDGIYRRTPLFYAWEDGFIPAISIAAAIRELGVEGDEIEIHWGKEIRIPLGPDEFISVPIDSSGAAIVPFGGKWTDTTHRYSMDILANAMYDREELSNIRDDIFRSLCFVADTTFEKKDVGPVPMEEIYPLSGIHTWVISAILDASLGEDSFFHISPESYKVSCVIILALVFFLFGMAKADKIFNIGAAVLFLLFTGITVYLWFAERILPWYGFGAFEIIFLWLFGFAYRFLTQRRRQSTLERYVPRSVAHKLVSGERTGLTPVHKDLTVMFTDICGFTGWSSGREAKDVHDFLNDYLESMADILFAHGATVDKFMGDGILSFLGDPVDMPNHAEQAVKAAIAMQEKIRTLGEKWQPRAGINLKVRMGINTGKVIVGDLGTQKRVEYTVIGSTVNLAQRMESLAAPGGILVTENTRNVIERLSPVYPFTFGEKRELAVKGYDEPVAAYEIVVA